MKVEYRITLNIGAEENAALRSMGVTIGMGIQTLIVTSTSANFNILIEYARSRNLPIIPHTSFTKKEILNSKASVIFATYITQYPEPANSYLNTSFDLSSYCVACGIGSKQKSPIWIGKEPKIGNRFFMQVNWLYDIIFISNKHIGVFKSLGMNTIPLLVGPSKKVSETICQIDLHVSNAHFRTSELDKSICPICGRAKFLPVRIGPYPPLLQSLNEPLMLSNEYFGSDTSASRRILMRQDLIEQSIRENWNLEYFVCAEKSELTIQ